MYFMKTKQMPRHFLIVFQFEFYIHVNLRPHPKDVKVMKI
jgi:hypothetical protein